MHTLSIHNKTRKYPIPDTQLLQKIKEQVLGKKYELSLIFCSDKFAKRINKEYRNKDYVPNTLSFPYSDSSGEVIINLNKSFKEARTFGHKQQEHILFLFIHSLLHLKGHRHGHKMEKLEKNLFLKFAS